MTLLRFFPGFFMEIEARKDRHLETDSERQTEEQHLELFN